MLNEVMRRLQIRKLIKRRIKDEGDIEKDRSREVAISIILTSAYTIKVLLWFS